MKTEQLETIVSDIQNSGYGYISKDNCAALAMIVYRRLVRDAVFTPLEERELAQLLANTIPRNEYADAYKAGMMRAVDIVRATRDSIYVGSNPLREGIRRGHGQAAIAILDAIDGSIAKLAQQHGLGEQNKTKEKL